MIDPWQVVERANPEYRVLHVWPWTNPVTLHRYSSEFVFVHGAWLRGPRWRYRMVKAARRVMGYGRDYI